ncbi:MAG TPA: hypothetical protein VLF88_01225 [Candidatus Babeliales bacterium]|nr:hypothetical protein [Candidatus Babeliales bacterium]
MDLFDRLLGGAVVVLVLMEAAILANIINHHKFSSKSAGDWHVYMSSTMVQTLSWIVVVLAIFVLFAAAFRMNLTIVLGLLICTFFYEFWFGRELPAPQGRWDLGLAFAAGALCMYVARETKILNFSSNNTTPATPPATP